MRTPASTRQRQAALLAVAVGGLGGPGRGRAASARALGPVVAGEAVAREGGGKQLRRLGVGDRVDVHDRTVGRYLDDVNLDRVSSINGRRRPSDRRGGRRAPRRLARPRSTPTSAAAWSRRSPAPARAGRAGIRAGPWTTSAVAASATVTARWPPSGRSTGACRSSTRRSRSSRTAASTTGAATPCELSRATGFEQVAALLWTGDEPTRAALFAGDGARRAWSRRRPRSRSPRGCASTSCAAGRPHARDPGRAAGGRRCARRGAGGGGPVRRRRGPRRRTAGRAPGPGLAHGRRRRPGAALVLCADHELDPRPRLGAAFRARAARGLGVDRARRSRTRDIHGLRDRPGRPQVARKTSSATATRCLIRASS